MRINGQSFSVSTTRYEDLLHSAASIRPRTFSTQYTHLASPIRRLLVRVYAAFLRVVLCYSWQVSLTRILARRCL